MNRLLNVITMLLIAISLVSCGGGTSGTGTTDDNNNPGPFNGVSQGTITQFGSIFVNGVEFETTSSSISIDGVSGRSQSDLKIGMVVLVQGDITGNTGTAVNIIAEDVVEGPVDQIIDSNTIVVMGQTVQIDTNTIFDNNVPNFAGIALGNVLEVSGHVKSNGVIAAAYIEKKTVGPFDYEVKGFIQNHNHALQSFNIGSLTVNYGTATTTDMPAPSGSNWNNLLVEVKGTVLAGGTLTASKVEPFGFGNAMVNKLELEGFVTALGGANSFTLQNQVVQYNNSTVFEGGVASDIAVGTKLEVEGALANGVLTVTKISFRDNVRLEGDADVIMVGNNEFTIDGLPGVTVRVDNLTEFKGNLATLSDINAGEHLRIRGRELSGNIVIATEIEDRSADPRVILQAPVDSFASPSVTMLGVTVDTSTIDPTADFRDVNDSPITPAQFFSSLQVGKLVKARGDLGTGIVWDQIELEE